MRKMFADIPRAPSERMMAASVVPPGWHSNCWEVTVRLLLPPPKIKCAPPPIDIVAGERGGEEGYGGYLVEGDGGVGGVGKARDAVCVYVYVYVYMCMLQ